MRLLGLLQLGPLLEPQPLRLVRVGVGVGVRVGVRLRARARPRARVGVRVRVRGRGSPPRLLLQGDAAPLLLSEGQGAGEGLGREGSLSVLDDTKPVGEPGKG
tara:strand:- start:41 stop:349 length:309 start_codon:yes stop_codon:yes gene_type:complete